MSKRALLVGINHFAQPGSDLRGCVNDTIAMRGLLQEYFGFQGAEIRVLADREATGRGIRDGLGWLLSGYEGGDVRVFHFSSHGTQVPDDTGDELEVQDEVLVPHDHDWEAPFRDDDLRAIFDQIPDGVAFTFIADCCHSGTIQRGLFESDVPFRPRFLPPPGAVADAIRAAAGRRDAAADAYAAAHLAELMRDVPPEQWSEKLQGYLAELRRKFRENRFAVTPYHRHFLLGACEDRQTAADARIEGDFRGAFTWALSKAVKEANGDLTYDDLIARAGANLRDFDQIAQLECPAGVRTAKLFAPLA